MGSHCSYRDLVAKIHLCARALKAMGIREGDRVTICMPNCPQTLIMFYAVNLVGADGFGDSVSGYYAYIGVPSYQAGNCNDRRAAWRCCAGHGGIMIPGPEIHGRPRIRHL